MKSFLPLAWLLLFALNTYGQDTTANKHLTKQEYLQKSNLQKRSGWVLLGTGLTMCAASLLIPRGEKTGTMFGIPGGTPTYQRDDIKAGLMIGGAVCSIVSFSLFIRSSKSKKKALALY